MPLFRGETKRLDLAPKKAYAVDVAREMCKECAFCIQICPVPVFRWSETVNAMGWRPVEVEHEENCIGCMLCQNICPDFCIAVTERGAGAAGSGGNFDATAGGPPRSVAS